MLATNPIELTQEPPAQSTLTSVRPAVSAIVVSFNTRETTLKCLAALQADLASIVSEVIVIDNASTDGSVQAIEQQFPLATVVASSRNLGFAAANNLALTRATGEYLLLINSDAFVEPGAVGALAKYLDENPNAGVVGPRLVNADGSLQLSCFPFPSPARAWAENLWLSAAFANHSPFGDYRRWRHDSARHVDFVSGACMMVRRQVHEKVGGFDDRFFMYAEETDWQRRIWRAGWKVAFTPTAVVTHLGGASGKSDGAGIRRAFFESLDLYQLKHHGLAGLVILRMAMIVGCTARVIAWSGVWLISSARRSGAAAKLRLHLWLLRRQTTHWRLNAAQGGK